MKVKICGLFREEDMHYVNEANPDYIGFVFASSSRQVSRKKAKELRGFLKADCKVVGVFVDEPVEKIEEMIEEGIIDFVQLHGTESMDYIDRLKKNKKITVIKALRIGEEIPNNADYLLFDSNIAGSGTTFDWSKIPHTTKPYFIAGGIQEDNLEQVVSKQPFGIDVSSGVEVNGVKDREKILNLVRRIRNVKG